MRYILQDVLPWLPVATVLKTFEYSLVCHTAVHNTSYMRCAVYILRLTGGQLGAGVLHVTKDLVPCATLCLPACRLPAEYGGMLGKTKAGLKGFLDSTSWP